jgi:hypothetical protein
VDKKTIGGKSAVSWRKSENAYIGEPQNENGRMNETKIRAV